MQKKKITNQSIGVLEAQQRVNKMREHRASVKKELQTLAKEEKREQRKASALKQKANKIDLEELMEMVMLKAYSAVNSSVTQSSSSSSGDYWMPQNVDEAWSAIRKLVPTPNKKQADADDEKDKEKVTNVDDKISHDEAE